MTGHAPPTNLGKLIEVDIREAWSHEALSFTPWLSTNLDRLAEALGISLELVGTETGVGPFSADILAIDPADGSRVLIENQLERSDHTHLGQVLTYLAGLEAQTIVWIARDFTDAHLSAIRWLNQHTVEPFAFFAVKVRAVRIGASEIAPLFDVVERPNDWERSVQKAARETTGTSGLNAFWRDWWTHYFAKHPSGDERPFALSVRWIAIPDTPLFVAQFIAESGVGVYVRGDRGVPREETVRVLEDVAEKLAERLGAPMDGRIKNHHFGKRLKIDTRDRANWDVMADWVLNEAARYVQVVSQTLKEGP